MTGAGPGTGDVTAVVVAFRRPEALASLLGRLKPLPVVVVNVAADAAVHRVAAEAGAAVIDLGDNPGYSAAVNRGVEAAETDVVVFMNDDIRLGARDIEHLRVHLDTADVVAPLILAGDVVDSAAFALPTPGRLLVEWALLPDRPIGCLRWLQPEKWRRPLAPVEVPAVAGTVVMARRSLLADVPLPEEYFLYWEDLAWCSLLHRTGRSIRLVPDVTATHAGGRDEVRPDKSRLLSRNAVRCVRRTQGRVRAAAAWPVVVLWNLRLLAVALVRRRHVAARWAGLRAAAGAWREIT